MRYVLGNPGVKVCQEIATAAKHVGADHAVETEVESDTFETWDLVSGVDALLDVDELLRGWKLKIIDGDRRIDALPLFEQALGFWTNLIYHDGVDGE